MKHGGADRAALSERKDDLYETPPDATRALMRVEPLPKVIWEPAAGRGSIARELVGHTVIMTDLVPHPDADPGIQTGVDFLMETKAPPGAQAIVTNPPYKLANEFIRHGLGLVPTVIVLLRLVAMEGTSRSDLIDRHLVRVWAGRERLPMMHREGFSGKKLKSGAVPFAWFVFSAHPRPAGTPFAVQRMSWREPTSQRGLFDGGAE